MTNRKPWDKGGKTRQQQGYGRAHELMREHLKRTVILCEHCTAKGRTTAGSHADHIIPLAKGGTHDRSNYQWLCEPCHRKKTLRENGRRAKPTFGPDGWPIEE